MIKFCLCKDEKPDPCLACGATVSGKDKVNGRCQARYGYREPYPLKLILVHRDTGEPI